MTKRLIVLAAVAGLSAGFWLLAKSWIENPSFTLTEWQLWARPLALLVLLAAAQVTTLMIVKGRAWRLGILTVPGLVFLAVFGVKTVYLLVPSAVLLGAYFALSRADDEMRSRILVHPKAVARRTLAYVILPLFLGLSLVYSQNDAVQESARQKKLPPVVTQTIEEVSRQVIAYQARQANLTPAQMKQVEKAFIQEIFAQLNQLIKPYLKYFQYLPFLVGLGMLLVLWGFSFIYAPLTVYLVSGLFEGLKYVKFFSVIELDSKAQKIEPL